MIPVALVPEPPGFDEQVRQRGMRWMAENPGADRPRNYWSPFFRALREGFKNLCGYSAMLDFSGTVDHFHSFQSRPDLAYEWSNYRYATSRINSSKRAREMIDPYEVQEGWFEVRLPSMQIVLTDKAPAHVRARAERHGGMLEWLNSEIFKDIRIEWYTQYKVHNLPLENLRDYAPLIAAAVEKELGQQVSKVG
jgi:hypothetical protein